ncbi:hypothetical protein HMPREF1051_2548 [Neisseria sicca VK64]|uniref:Uncharacterized protein n=1 Tax=Neisseria sicca VK64 TaxID=1095748 RepID=I2NUN7_NEISI|nr:hypothetical protein HMPREF1051_2548 [Neisseria sicca VK64]
MRNLDLKKVSEFQKWTPACAGMTEKVLKTGKIGDICDTANKVTVAQRSSENPSHGFQTTSKSDTCLFAFNLLYLAAGD